MQIQRLGGLNQITETFTPATKIQIEYTASGAIPVGSCVRLVAAANTDGSLVAMTTATTDNEAAVGIYEGVGGTGADATVAGTSGRAAVDGDRVLITAHGIAMALQDGGVTDTVVGEALYPEATSGYLIGGAAAVDLGGKATFLCQEAVTTDGGAGAVFVRCL